MVCTTTDRQTDTQTHTDRQTDVQTDVQASREGMETLLWVAQLCQSLGDPHGKLGHAAHAHQQVSMATVTWWGEVVLKDSCSDAATQTRPGREWV